MHFRKCPRKSRAHTRPRVAAPPNSSMFVLIECGAAHRLAADHGSPVRPDHRRARAAAGARWRAGCRPAALGARVRLRRLTEQVPSCAGRAAARTGGSRITPGLRPVRFSATPPRRTARRARATVGRLRSHISATQTGPRRGRAGRPRAEPGPSHHSRQSAETQRAGVSSPGAACGVSSLCGVLSECEVRVFHRRERTGKSTHIG